MYFHIPGASTGFVRGGGQKYFFSDLEICMLQALLGGFGGMLSRDHFFKWCVLVYIWIRFFKTIIFYIFFLNSCRTVKFL